VRKLRPILAAALLVATSVRALAAVHYVDASSTNATPPYTNWATAATNIQDAVDAAVAGDEVAVTNGTYAGGLNLNKPLTMRSVNGPQFTTISGGGRCVSMASNTSLSGFTVTGGYATFGGGVFCQSSNAVVSNCVITGNQAADGGGAYGGTLNNCTLASNSASYYDFSSSGDQSAAAGGAASCTLNNCTLNGNSASIINVYNYYGRDFAYGGGAAYCTLNNCALSNNWVYASSYFGYQTYQTASGGGAAYCTLNNCAVSGGSAQADEFSSAQCAGAYFSTLDHCTLSGNWGDGSGCALDCALNKCALTDNQDVGASFCTLSNCTLAGNYYGGAASSTLKNCALTGNLRYGASSCGLTNCTLTGNFGGGASNSTLNNCNVYFNTGSNYDSSSTLNYCCATPLPTNGVGNISSDPQLASASHLSALSPCIGKGSYAAVSGTDIDGEPWANPPSIGCDEYHAGAVTGPLSVAIAVSFTNVAVGYAVALTAGIEGRTDLSVWDFGDGALEINQPYATHSWAMPGDYLVSLWCFSDSYPGGTNATVTIHVVTGLHYVAGGSASPAAPYTSWSTAATNIQDALNAAAEAGGQVLVTNGTFSPITAYYIPVRVRSINGALFTVIDGGKTNRCATLGQYGSLTGFTLTNGVSSYSYGGGAYGGTLSNCALCGNLAAYSGGGAYNCTLNNCALSGNTATESGGGAYYATLHNCTLTGNSAYWGGGANGCTLNNCTLIGNSATNSGGGEYACTLNNCIVYFNTCTNDANYGFYSTLNYCCTTPLPTNGVGNISSDPQLASVSHLSAASPCRGAGSAAYANGTDIDGESWLNPPSIGCDEYRAGAVTGPLNAAINATFTSVQIGFAVGFTAMIEGRTTASTWDFGDGSMATNQPYTSHAWTALGDYLVVLRAYNESQPGGVSASMTIHVVTRPTYYVMANSANPSAPYLSWATTATNIQDALDAVTVPGALVLVTNGIYAGGGRVAGGATNRVVVGNLITVRSINGPLFTLIDGGRSNRCVYLADNTSLSGFTLTNGAASQGGGVQCASAAAVLSNCRVIGNSADWLGGGV
jgi:parallel beta-helix repeat protein